MYDFRIVPRSSEVGDGWQLKLMHGLEEVGGGVFPLDVYGGDSQEAYEAACEEGSSWLESKPEEERAGTNFIVDEAGLVFAPPVRGSRK